LVRAAAIAAVPNAPTSHRFAVAGLAGAALAGGLAMSRAHPGPGRQVPGAGEAAHVRAGLGDDDLSDGLPHSRDRRQVLKVAGKRAHLLLDPRRQFCDRRGELVDALQTQPAQKRVVVTEVAGQRLHQLWDLRAHPGLGHLGEHLRVAFAVDQRGQHRPPGDPEDVGGHRRQLDPGVFEFLLQPLRLSAAFGQQCAPVAGQVSQLPDRLRRHERGPQKPALTHLAQPGRIADIFSELKMIFNSEISGDFPGRYGLLSMVVRPAVSVKVGMPSWTAVVRWAVIWFIWASLAWAPARLTLRPSASPYQRWNSASAMRAMRLASTRPTN
jgi:hypothetical protein